ncbi:MAG: phospholipase D-like domain-containing protein [Candidatus Dormibacteria bacterium]|jgi:phosphatidylserine/phosphatidylglycerophosphate/cardiolipin synthase-like enzyme|nr:cardiolipin synthase [Chloroflexota bacterium]HBV94270.1 cardiolipin synthase [Chloroflexota bacterium]
MTVRCDVSAVALQVAAAGDASSQRWPLDDNRGDVETTLVCAMLTNVRTPSRRGTSRAARLTALPLSALLLVLGGCAASTLPQPSGAATATTAGSGAATPRPALASTPTGAAAGYDTLGVEPDQGLGVVYQAIAGAQHSIDLVMYELEDSTAVSDLVQAERRGVTVRVILDQAYAKSENQAAYAALLEGGVAVHWSSTQVDITHQKTLIVDAREALIMTGNLTSQYYATTRDFVVEDTDPVDVAAIGAVFDADFASSPVTPSAGDDLVWSPGSEPALAAIIQGARRQLLVENEEMSDPEIVAALEAAAKRGVDVEVCMTDSSSWSSEFDALVHAGVRVVTYAANASLYIHAKVIVADPGTSTEKAFVGSENFSSTSLDLNRELGIVLDGSAIDGQVAAVLEGDISGATAWSAS